MELNDTPVPATHQAIDMRWSGQPVQLSGGASQVALLLLPEMAADASGLVHGGFIFSAADHAAMLAVNHPNVVLGGAEVRFLKPSRVGERLVFQARVEEVAGRRHAVVVEGRNEAGADVFQGRFTCFVPDRHVLAAAPA